MVFTISIWGKCYWPLTSMNQCNETNCTCFQQIHQINHVGSFLWHYIRLIMHLILEFCMSINLTKLMKSLNSSKLTKSSKTTKLTRFYMSERIFMQKLQFSWKFFLTNNDCFTSVFFPLFQFNFNLFNLRTLNRIISYFNRLFSLQLFRKFNFIEKFQMKNLI